MQLGLVVGSLKEKKVISGKVQPVLGERSRLLFLSQLSTHSTLMGLGMQAVLFSYLLGRVATTAAMIAAVFGESKRVVAAAAMTIVVF
jgi:hypothetical protein